MADVTLRKVIKRYDDVEAVRGIDLDIADHEFVVLVGPSGCGKSTTLRMIAGLEDITDGDIMIGGDVVITLDNLTQRHVSHEVNPLSRRRSGRQCNSPSGRRR
jgi:ABC-type sugar transport system ATPase subunit